MCLTISEAPVRERARESVRCRTQPLEAILADELLEVVEKQTMSREAAAARLTALADQLARHNQVEFVREGIRFSAKVPSEVELSVEVEIGEESEIEIELSW